MAAVADQSTRQAENLHDCYAWRLERRMVRVRWLAVPAGLAVLLLAPRLSAPLIGLLVGSLVLGNLGIERLLRRARNSTHLRLTSALATGLEWGVAAGIVAACSRDFARTVPAVLAVVLSLMVVSTARYGLPGLAAALGGIAALLVLTGRVLHASIAWPDLIDLVIILAAASPISGGLVIWLSQEGKDRERERALRQRLQDDQRRWREDRATLLRLQSGLTEREWEPLPLLARDDLTYEQIADHLVVSVDTIKTHVHRLGRKWGSSGRRAIVAAARERGLLPPAGPGAAPPSG